MAESASSSSQSAQVAQLRVMSAPYGHHPSNNAPVTAYTLSNERDGGIEVTVIDYGAIVTSIKTPNKDGKKEEVVLGYGHLNDWVNGKPWLNSLVGRHANRIRDARFMLDGKTYQLERNTAGGHHLHGGANGFNARCMKSHIITSSDDRDTKSNDSKDHSTPSMPFVGVSMRFTSEDGDQGYPGTLDIEVNYRLREDNTIEMEFVGKLREEGPDKTRSTIINLCNHNYYNLSGCLPDSNILDHHLVINADQVTELSTELVPTGQIINVGDTPFDFRPKNRMATTSNPAAAQQTIGQKIAEVNKVVPEPGGYDINYVLNKRQQQASATPSISSPSSSSSSTTNSNLPSSLTSSSGLSFPFAARLSHPSSGRVMDVFTSAPGVQFYTGNFLDGSIVGREGKGYKKHAALCLETQTFPDWINHMEEWKEYPGDILRVGETYRHVTLHRFHTH